MYVIAIQRSMFVIKVVWNKTDVSLLTQEKSLHYTSILLKSLKIKVLIVLLHCLSRRALNGNYVCYSEMPPNHALNP